MCERRCGRILFDFSTSLGMSGPAVGIVRVERELARFGLAHVRGFALVCHAAATRGFRLLDPRFAGLFIDQHAQLDTFGLVDPARARVTDKLPAGVRSTLFWLLQFRRKFLQTLERRRLGVSDSAAAGWIARIQAAVMTPKYRALMTRPTGEQRPFVPFDMILREPVALGPDDILVCTGAGWVFGDIDALVDAKRRHGIRLVLFCHDIIPILFPEYYHTADAESFRTYMEAAFGAADLIVVNSRKTRDDTIAYCATRGITLGPVSVVPLGADFSHWSAEPAALPDRLQPNRYVLYVSTIEPRKNHRMLHSVWGRLVDEGVVARSGFKLVFVGRKGWLIDDLITQFSGDERIADTLVHLQDLDDRTIAALYRDAAFCCYPSAYEGYGLPILEAFHFGRAVLASTGGALPEVVGDLSPCLDPTDPDAWYRTLKGWIEEPSERAPYEARIRAQFKAPTWSDTAARFFAEIDRVVAADAPPDPQKTS